MNKKVGLWIDHKKSVVVTISDKGEETAQIVSDVGKQLRRTGDSPLKGGFEKQQVDADDSRQRAFTGHLNVYYDAVIAAVNDAEAVLIFGPGEAKEQLRDRFASRKLEGRIVAVETVDKMTDPQIAAKVRQYFAG